MKMIPIYIVWFKTRHGGTGYENPTVERGEVDQSVLQIKALGGVAIVRTVYCTAPQESEFNGDK